MKFIFHCKYKFLKQLGSIINRSYPLMEVWERKTPRRVFTMECQTCVKTQSDFWEAWSKKSCVSASMDNCWNRSLALSGTSPQRYHWEHTNKNIHNNCDVWWILFSSFMTGWWNSPSGSLLLPRLTKYETFPAQPMTLKSSHLPYALI